MLPSLRGPRLRGQRASAAALGGTDRSGSYLGRGSAHGSLASVQYWAVSVNRLCRVEGVGSLHSARLGVSSSALLRGSFGAGVARQSNNRLERSRGLHLRGAKEGVGD